LGFGSAFPVYTAHIMKHVASTRRGAAFGSMLAAFDTGIGTGSMTLGYIIEHNGFRAAWALAAVIAALALPYFLTVEPRVLAKAP
jgi:predicted MFS family arabinose efflux permease